MNERIIVKMELIKRQNELFELWLEELSKNNLINSRSKENTTKLSASLFNSFIKLLQSNSIINLEDKEFAEAKAGIEGFAKTMAIKGQSSTTTPMYIFSLKSTVSRFLYDNYSFNVDVLNEEILKCHEIVDKMWLHIFEYFVKERDRIIKIQQEDMLELSTPVIKVWNEILVVPLIGTLDSKRTQIVMEKLLDSIISTSAKVAILDITGVPTVDTYVANHLINTSTAARLLGSEIIITGISPSIAQIMVHLGIDLSGIITRAIMEDGLKLALEMCDYKIIKVKNS